MQPDTRLPIAQRDLAWHLHVLLHHSEFRGNRSAMLRAATDQGLPEVPTVATLSKHLGRRAARYGGPSWKICHLFVLLCSPPALYPAVLAHFADLWRAAHGSWPPGYLPPDEPAEGPLPSTPAPTVPKLAAPGASRLQAIDANEHRRLTMALVRDVGQRDTRHQAVHYGSNAAMQAQKQMIERLVADLDAVTEALRRERQRNAELHAQFDTYYDHPSYQPSDPVTDPAADGEPWRDWFPPLGPVVRPDVHPGPPAALDQPPLTVPPAPIDAAEAVSRRQAGLDQRTRFLLEENRQFRRQIAENKEEIRQIRTEQAFTSSGLPDPTAGGLSTTAAINPVISAHDPTAGPEAPPAKPSAAPDDANLPDQPSPN